MLKGTDGGISRAKCRLKKYVKLKMLESKNCQELELAGIWMEHVNFLFRIYLKKRLIVSYFNFRSSIYWIKQNFYSYSSSNDKSLLLQTSDWFSRVSFFFTFFSWFWDASELSINRFSGFRNIIFPSSIFLALK